MILDLILLSAYFMVLMFSKPEHRTTSGIVFCWFGVSMFVAYFSLPAVFTFPIYWCMAGIMCVVLTMRGVGLILIGMTGMFLLQMSLTVDAFITSEITDLYSNYSLLAFLLNIVLILLTFIHGRGLDSVDHNNLYCNTNNSNRKSN
jgi:hypothetical protein